MAYEDWKEKYGPKVKFKTRMNHSIRAEIAGGSELIDAITVLQKAIQTVKEKISELEGGENEQALEVIQEILPLMCSASGLMNESKEKMTDQIKLNYGMSIEPPEKERDLELPE